MLPAARLIKGRPSKNNDKLLPVYAFFFFVRVCQSLPSPYIIIIIAINIIIINLIVNNNSQSSITSSPLGASHQLPTARRVSEVTSPRSTRSTGAWCVVVVSLRLSFAQPKSTLLLKPPDRRQHPRKKVSTLWPFYSPSFLQQRKTTRSVQRADLWSALLFHRFCFALRRNACACALPYLYTLLRRDSATLASARLNLGRPPLSTTRLEAPAYLASQDALLCSELLVESAQRAPQSPPAHTYKRDLTSGRRLRNGTKLPTPWCMRRRRSAAPRARPNLLTNLASLGAVQTQACQVCAPGRG